MVLTMTLLDWEYSTLITNTIEVNPYFSKNLDRKKKSNTVWSSMNSPSNLVNNVFAIFDYLGFNIKLLLIHRVSLTLC